MTRHVWELHAKVFELARARGLREFRVNYRNAGREIVIALVMAPANDTRLAGGGMAEHPR
jgi:ABC-type dipeptide/oligopeptide/nickel transport system permease component